jgi:hypothetical protein
MILEKKNIVFVVIIILFGMIITPGISNVYAINIYKLKNQTLEVTQIFSEPLLIDTEHFIEIYSNEANSYLNDDGSPMMPVFTKVYEFPLGTKITDIKLFFLNVSTKRIEKQIKPVPCKQKIGNIVKSLEPVLNQEVYSSSKPFPNKWFSYTLGAGLNKNNQHKLLLTLHIYPVRYCPMNFSIQYLEQIQASISYQLPEMTKINGDIYDFVIISPLEFSDNLEMLIQHKEDYGLRTHHVNLKDIYTNFSGRDRQEKIKFFIKYAIEEWGINYILSHI